MDYQAIPGLGVIPVSTTEYFSPQILTQFTGYMATLKNALDQINSQSNPSQATLAATYDTIINTLQNLQTLANNGVVVGTGSSAYTMYLNPTMVTALDEVMRSFQIVGISASSSLNTSPTDKAAAIQSWQSLSPFVEEILTSAIGLQTQASGYNAIDPVTGKTFFVQQFPEKSLQSMLELEYVKIGNQIISSQLTTLESGFQTTQAVLGTLQNMESIANQITVQTPSGFTFPTNPDPTSSDITGFENAYQKAASAYFSNIIPTPVPSSTAAADLYHSKITLSAQLTTLLQQDPTQTVNTPNSLAQSLYNVIHDISAAFSSVNYKGDPNALLSTNPTQFQANYLSAVSQWILDNQDQVATTADNQQNGIVTRLNQAITNAENTGSDQKDTVNRYLYIFEQFYKTASAMLELLSTIINKVADGFNKTS